MGNGLLRPSADNHFVHLAASFLSGQLSVIGGDPKGMNDWACYDTRERGPCPPDVFRFSGRDRERYRWYVSFPPLPAIVVLPVVAAYGTAIPDRLFWALLAGFAPALLYVLLRFLRESGRSARTPRENAGLSLLFAFGSVYYFTAVQGTVWFAAHAVACALLPLYVLWSIGARRPLLAGLMLALAFLTRPTMLLLAPLFLIETLSAARGDAACSQCEGASLAARLRSWLGGVNWRAVVAGMALFSVPIALAVGAQLWLNAARFDDPLVFGHEYLQIFWRPRIEKWGLFNYHYLSKNLAVFLAALPWFSAAYPYVRIGRHGLALWVTTPGLLGVLWPRRTSTFMVGLSISAGLVAVCNLAYQNSGWIQFGYRFALDYMALLIALLALGGRRFGAGFWLMLVVSVAVNAFGAITFDKMWQFYDGDATQSVVFQPD